LRIQSFSGKICPDCSKSSFILDCSISSYTEFGNSIRCDTYVCPNCGLKVKHFSHAEDEGIEISDSAKMEEIAIPGSH
jgi:rubredoxin